jgi:hypothetical protein
VSGKIWDQNDASFVDAISSTAEKVADSISHKLHPMIEQYANLFKNGARTPVLRRPSDYGMGYEDVFFPSLDGVPLEGWFIPPIPVSCSSLTTR